MDTKRKSRLLIIDDEKDICSFQKNIFKRRGFNTFTASSGTKAIALARKVKPDAAILDIHMAKGLSGIDILKKLLKVIPNCRCIMVTWDEEKARQAKELGAADFLIKPVELNKLERAVDKALRSLKNG